MRKITLTLLLTLTTAFGFTETVVLSTQPAATTDLLKVPEKPELKVSDKKDWFAYLKMVASDSYPEKVKDLVPGFGLGFRVAQKSHALDISINGARGQGWGRGIRNYSWSFPKASYLYYFNPSREQSFYLGGGFAWERLQTKGGTKFLGISSNAVLGLEMFRKAGFRTFLELNVNQPTIARSTTGPFPGPLAEISVGAGF